MNATYRALVLVAACLAALLLSAGETGDGSIRASEQHKERPEGGSFRSPEHAGEDPTRADGRPNIVLVLTDDLDVRSAARLRGIEAMVADRGMKFNRAFVSDPLCCPSRASILRGQYVHNHGVTNQLKPDGGYSRFRPLEGSTVAVWLDEAGYRTGFVGKYMNNYDTTYVPPGWDEWYGWMGNFYDPDQRKAYRINENGKERTYPPGRYHDTDLLAEKALRFISRAVRDGEPFFLYLSVNAPHSPPSVAPRHRNDFANVYLPRAPSYNERDISDKPRWVRSTAQLKRESSADQTGLYRQRLRSMLSVEDAMRRIMGTLKKAGELENTYIFFTSDNGFHMGEHRLGSGKRTPYMEDIRVPLYVRGPGVPEGETGRLVSNIDLAPTFAQLAGAGAPAFVDGRSLVPLLEGRRTGWRSQLLVEGYREGTLNSQLRIPTYRALVRERSIYTEYRSEEKEFYYLDRDPYQLRNLYRKAAPALRARLHSNLSRIASCAGEACRRADGP